MHVIEVEKLNYRIGSVTICKDMTLSVKKGSIHGLIGPNGSGKSTLLQQICGVIHPKSGNIKINGRDFHEFTQKELSRQIAVLFQENFVDFNYTVEEIVAMGRIPYHTGVSIVHEDESEIIDDALSIMGVLPLKNRVFNSLSGGEKQRVLLSRALVQDTGILLLDEPTNNLDIGYQYHIFEKLETMDKTIVTIVHDMNIAARFCDVLSIVYDGRIIKTGTPKKILTEDIFRNIFSVDANITKSFVDGKLNIEFLKASDNIR